MVAVGHLPFLRQHRPQQSGSAGAEPGDASAAVGDDMAQVGRGWALCNKGEMPRIPVIGGPSETRSGEEREGCKIMSVCGSE